MRATNLSQQFGSSHPSWSELEKFCQDWGLDVINTHTCFTIECHQEALSWGMTFPKVNHVPWAVQRSVAFRLRQLTTPDDWEYCE